MFVFLFIVKKICEAHGGNVIHNSELLSKYNIPVLYNYKYNKYIVKKRKNNVKEIENYEKEIIHLGNMIEKEVVNNTNFVKYEYVFSSRINMPTFRNTFIVTIPLH